MTTNVTITSNTNESIRHSFDNRSDAATFTINTCVMLLSAQTGVRIASQTNDGDHVTITLSNGSTIDLRDEGTADNNT